jgi:hypothetical protein
MEQVKKRSIVLGLCCSLVCSPVWAKTFVGVLYPLFGPMAAIGLVELASELRSMPDVEVATYLHQSWKSLVDDINRQPKGTHILIVGYSLGANNAILVANNTGYIDSIIALQPSMLTSQDSLTGSVGKIIEIYNPNPWLTFGGMGSQKLVAPNIEYIENNDSHPGAQFNSQFHVLVKNEVARLIALDDPSTAQLKGPKPSQPTKQAKTTEPPKSKVAKQERPEHQPTTQALASTGFPDPISSLLNSEAAKPEEPEHQVRVQAFFPEPKSTSANSDDVLAQRALTITDMKEYVKRNYPSPQRADLTR